MLVSDAGQYKEDKDSVSLMTLHSAKGLEFKVVFILGMEEEYSHIIEVLKVKAN